MNHADARPWRLRFTAALPAAQRRSLLRWVPLGMGPFGIGGAGIRSTRDRTLRLAIPAQLELIAHRYALEHPMNPGAPREIRPMANGHLRHFSPDVASAGEDRA